jgi:CRP-like cAMP-binding protein
MVPKSGIFLDKNDELKRTAQDDVNTPKSHHSEEYYDSQSIIAKSPNSKSSPAERFTFETSFTRASMLEVNPRLGSDSREGMSPLKRPSSPSVLNKTSVRLRKMIDQWYSYMIPVKEINPGETFGEISLITQAKREATVIALENTQLFSLNQRVYESIVG